MRTSEKEIQRKSLSIKRLYKLVQGFIKKNPKVDMSLVNEFLDYIDKHKNDNL